MQFSFLLPLLLAVPISSLELGQNPPISPANGTLRCTPSSSTAPSSFGFRRALERLLTSPATAPFIGDSGLSTRRRCWQKEEKGDHGCTILASYEDAKISVCGDAYASMLCEDVANVVRDVLRGCQDGDGGEWITTDVDGFLVKVYTG
jgi:hypothetical protein